MKPKHAWSTLSQTPTAFAVGLLFVVSGVACNDDDPVSSAIGELDGRWELTLHADNSFVNEADTSKGQAIVGLDEFSAVHEEVHLFEESGVVEGFAGPFTFRGTRTGDSVSLEAYEFVDGHHGQVDDVTHVGTMTLRLDEQGRLEGTGVIHHDPDSTGATNDTYTVEARKIGQVSDAASLSMINASAVGASASIPGFGRRFCDAVGSAMSFAIGWASGSTIRPMGGCWGRKNGGGYYLFGEVGPGSLAPVWTQTAYYPIEWSWCKVRKYSFKIRTQGRVRSIEALETVMAGVSRQLESWGLSDLANARAQARDFFDQVGGFAISIGVSSRTHNVSIYINLENDNGTNRSIALAHPLVTTLSSTMNSRFSGVWIFAGNTISDTWHLRRGMFGPGCSTPLTFAYLIGTNKVEYD